MLSQRPVDDADRLFAGISLDRRRRVLAAVSGGGDSLALLVLLKAHFDRQPNGPTLLAVTVDHRLRAVSAREAEEVAAFCARHGIAHRIVAWQGVKPVTGLSSAARETRHRLLADAAGAAGSDIVLTGHTGDDQAETVTMRAARGPGRGAAGIAPATLYDGRVWFVRPLLDARRGALRACLRARNVDWIDDPTNTDMRHERARVRRALDDAAIDAALRGARKAGAARVDLGRRAADLIERFCTMAAPGLIDVSRDLPGQDDREAAVYALRILLALVGGREQLAEGARASALLARIAAVPSRDTLSRTVVDARGSVVHLYREARNLPTVSMGAAGAAWDGRYRIAGLGDDGQTEIGPFGRRNAEAVEPRVAGAPASPRRAALAAEPALWRGGESLGLVRDRPGIVVTPVPGPWARYLPSFDMAPARAAARLVGAALPPDPPFSGHLDR